MLARRSPLRLPRGRGHPRRTARPPRRRHPLDRAARSVPFLTPPPLRRLLALLEDRPSARRRRERGRPPAPRRVRRHRLRAHFNSLLQGRRNDRRLRPPGAASRTTLSRLLRRGLWLRSYCCCPGPAPGCSRSAGVRDSTGTEPHRRLTAPAATTAVAPGPLSRSRRHAG